MKILRNLLTIHFFGKILTHASMGDCFFFMRPLCPPRTRMSHGLLHEVGTKSVTLGQSSQMLI